MAVEEVARQIKKWAIKNKILGDYSVAPNYDQNTIREVFKTAGLAAAVNVLQKKHISYIGINRQNKEVVVFTEKKLTFKDESMFGNLRVDDIFITFQNGGTAQIGGHTIPPVGIPPYAEHKGRYACGSSVFIAGPPGAGTFGCLVQDKEGALFGLSNNHVTGGSNYASVGLQIMAPGMADAAANQKDPITIGHHSRAYPFCDGLPDVVNTADNIDAALFQIKDASTVTSMQRAEYDTPSSIIPLKEGQKVEKIGRTTGKTLGIVRAKLFDPEPIWYTIEIINGKKLIFFNDMFVIQGSNGQPFSLPGDSGSLITFKDDKNERHSVGLLVGGSNDGLTLAISIDRILAYFGVNIVGNHNI